MNLLEGLHQGIKRAEEIHDLYMGLPGDAGGPGAALIAGMIKRAELSIQSGSIEEMTAAHKALREIE